MCGIFAITNNSKSAYLTRLGLFALQHRGQESAGIAADDGKNLNLYTAMGLVSEVFDEKIINSLVGKNAIGHVRYSTTGQSSAKNSQPLLFDFRQGKVAVCHNGNLTNYNHLHKFLSEKGAIFQTTVDSEIIAHLMARSEAKNIEQALITSLPKLCGAYSFLFLTRKKLIGVRDPLGFRPLVLGKLGKSYILASETSAIKIIGANVVRDIKPGEMVIIENGKVKSLYPFKKQDKTAVCIFEHIYLARPDSIVSDKSISSYRYKMGQYLARQLKGLKADFVIPVLDSGIFAALGFARESKIPFNMGFVRSHYAGRSFIEATQAERELAVRLKLAPIPDNIKNKDIILIDDSIVRGTTSRLLVKYLKSAGVGKIHMVVSSPPIIGSCFYGIDTPEKKKLIAYRLPVEKIRKSIGVDTLNYLTLENLLKACGGLNKNIFCTACFTGRYPTKIPEDFK